MMTANQRKVVMAIFLIHFVTLGQMLSFGTFVPILETELAVNRTGISLIGTSQYGVFLSIGAMISGFYHCCSGFDIKRLNRMFAFIGVLFWFIGHFTCSFLMDYPAFISVYTIFGGVGAGLAYWNSIRVLKSHFSSKDDQKKLLPLANMAISIGPSLYGIIYPLIESQLTRLDAFLFFSILGTIVLFLASFWIQSAESENPLIIHSAEVMSRGKTTRKSFIVFITSVALFQMAFYVPYVHLIPLAQDAKLVNLPPLISLIHVGSFMGRIVFPVLMVKSKSIHGEWELLMFASAGMTLMLIAGVGVPVSLPSLVVFALSYGFFSGGCFVLFFVIMVKHWNSRLFLLSAAMIPGGVGAGIIAAAIREGTGNYHGAIIYTAVMSTFSTIGFMILCCS